MPNVQLLGPQDYSIQKWKNGRGTTSQLAIEPRDADFALDPFIWRISSARINSDGPFSQFLGCDRILRIIDGSELEIHNLPAASSDAVKLLHQWESVLFAGEDEIIAKIPFGEVIDYNVIWNRSKGVATSEFINASVSVKINGVDCTSLYLTVFGEPVNVQINSSQNYQLNDWTSLRIDFENLDDHLLLAANFDSEKSKLLLTRFKKTDNLRSML